MSFAWGKTDRAICYVFMGKTERIYILSASEVVCGLHSGLQCKRHYYRFQYTKIKKMNLLYYFVINSSVDLTVKEILL